MNIELRVNLNGRKGFVRRSDYVRVKTKQLRDFGYGNLTYADVDKQVDALLEGKKLGEGLTVIGAFMKDEVLG